MRAVKQVDDRMSQGDALSRVSSARCDGGVTMDDDQDWPSQLRHLVDGDDQAVRAFWDEYGARLQALAARHLSPRLQLREAPEDVAQSVCRTFFRRAREGQFSLSDSGCLWRLLCVITITKTREKARFHGRDKRAWKREQRLATDADDSVPGIWHLASSEPDPSEAAELADQIDALADQLDDEERTVLTLKLNEIGNREIASQLGCSERTVRRILERLQSRLRHILGESLAG